MTKLERRAKIECLNLRSHRFRDFRMAVTQPGCPQTGVTIKDPPATIIRKPHILCCNDDTGIALELPVSRVGHPVGIEWQLIGHGASCCRSAV